MGPLAPPLRVNRKGKSIGQLSFQLNDFHEDFQQTLNGTNLFTLIKAESILDPRVDGNNWP